LVKSWNVEPFPLYPSCQNFLTLIFRCLP
jgi:hypothetical protein